MCLKQVEYIVGRRQYHTVPAGQDERLQNIDCLGEISHLYAVAMVVKNVQGGSCCKRIPKRVLLIEKSSAIFVPHNNAPLVYDQGYLFSGIVTIHDGGMTGNYPIHA